MSALIPKSFLDISCYPLSHMGIDFLDCCFRIEKEFKLTRGDLDTEKLDLPRNKKGVLIGATAADLARWVEACIAATGQQPPPDLWPRVQACIAATVSVPPGRNRFDKPGERSYLATLDGHPCGVCHGAGDIEANKLSPSTNPASLKVRP